MSILQLSVVAMIGVVVSYATGSGNVCGFIITKIFPIAAIYYAMALGTTLNWLASWCWTFFFPLLSQFWGATRFLFLFSSMPVPYFYDKLRSNKRTEH